MTLLCLIQLVEGYTCRAIPDIICMMNQQRLDSKSRYVHQSQPQAIFSYEKRCNILSRLLTCTSTAILALFERRAGGAEVAGWSCDAGEAFRRLLLDNN